MGSGTTTTLTPTIAQGRVTSQILTWDIEPQALAYTWGWKNCQERVNCSQPFGESQHFQPKYFRRIETEPWLA